MADPEDEAHKEDLVRAFAQLIGPIEDYIVGPDMGTNETAMGWIRDEIGRCVGLPTAVGGIPLDEIGATGFGLAIAAEVAAEHGGPALDGARVAMQGFGAVGKHAARFLGDRGAILVAAADINGMVYDPEGLDLDEAGNGSATVMVDGAIANGNEDQGIKIDESDNGSLYATLIDVVANDSLSQHGTEFTEEDNGSLDVVISDSEISGNDDGAVAGEQTGKGYGLLTVIDSDLTGNDECSFEELDYSIDVDLQGTTVIDVCP